MAGRLALLLWRRRVVGRAAAPGKAYETVLQSVAQMLAHGRFGARGIPRLQGAQDFEMLDYRGVVAGLRDEAAEAARQVNLVLETGNGLDQPFVVRRADEHHVEIAADAHPLFRCLKTQLRPRIQAVQLFLEVVELVNGNIRAPEARRDRLQTLTHIVDLDDILDRQAGDKGAFAFDHPHQPFAREHEDRLADRGAADAELGRQRTFGKWLAHGDFAVQNHGLEPLIR